MQPNSATSFIHSVPHCSELSAEGAGSCFDVSLMNVWAEDANKGGCRTECNRGRCRLGSGNREVWCSWRCRLQLRVKSQPLLSVSICRAQIWTLLLHLSEGLKHYKRPSRTQSRFPNTPSGSLASLRLSDIERNTAYHMPVQRFQLHQSMSPENYRHG